jgi:transcriptional regulator with XRE-family HTH domain
MSMQTISTEVPEFDEADRLRKALRVADVPVQDMADYLGVSRNTVSRWINGAVPAKGAVLRAWALRTGVSYEWLAAGRAPSRSRRLSPVAQGNTRQRCSTI